VSAYLLRGLQLALIFYVGLCAALYIFQRHLIFVPPSVRLGEPPAGSIYRSLDVEVPGLGHLTAWRVPPVRPDLPTLVFFHGNASDRSDLYRAGEAIHARGWGLVLASYRGYSGNPGDPSEAGLIEDARATLAALGPLPGPILVWGHSLGTYVAAKMASEGRAAGLILESPYTSITTMAWARYPYVPVPWLISDPFDTTALIPSIQVPVLIIHGQDDPLIPIAMGRDLANRLGDRATFVTLDGVGHLPHQRDLSPMIARWMADKGLTTE
jgi:pimeloyl-ACP methyl ester carboxylesterase